MLEIDIINLNEVTQSFFDFAQTLFYSFNETEWARNDISVLKFYINVRCVFLNALSRLVILAVLSVTLASPRISL